MAQIYAAHFDAESTLTRMHGHCVGMNVLLENGRNFFDLFFYKLLLNINNDLKLDFGTNSINSENIQHPMFRLIYRKRYNLEIDTFTTHFDLQPNR